VPGGTAAYPSSVLNERRGRRKSPASSGWSWSRRRRAARIDPLVLVAARLGRPVDEVYRIGGAQAIAALAYGTSTIAPVAKIMGAGGTPMWLRPSGSCSARSAIDLIAGPSEVPRRRRRRITIPTGSRPIFLAQARA